MKYFTFLGFLVLQILLCVNSVHQEVLDKRLLYYEPLHYDQTRLHQQHTNIGKSGDLLLFKFQAFNRTFSLELRRVPLSSKIILHHKKKSTTPDLSFVYTGKDTGYFGSEARVAVINGTFQGKIKHQGETTYHIVPSSWLFKRLPHFHTVIYSEKDYKWSHTFPADTVHSSDKQDQEHEKQKERRKRDLPLPPTPQEHHVCSLKLTTDSTVWKYYMNLNQNEDRSHYDILFMLESHVAEANAVFKNAEFTLNTDLNNDIKGKSVQFEIREIEIMTDSDCNDSSSVGRKSGLCNENLDGHSVLKTFADEEELKSFDYYDYSYDNSYDEEYSFVEIHPEDSFISESPYCLSFLITARVLYSSKSNPLLGLAHRPEKGKAGGVCSPTANVGFVTLFLDTLQALPALVTQLVFTHEIAHAFGAVHDNMKECSEYNLNQEPPDGYYLMHSVAQRGDKPNHKKFSDCSLKYIAETLADQENTKCFTASELPYCGNGIVDDGEECDCGSDCASDKCCHSHNATKGLKCTLKKGAQCSPSQGPCCNSSMCQYIQQSENFVCQNARPCMDQLYCHGEVYGAQCPPPSNSDVRPDGFICSPNGRVCDSGSCNASICKLIQWHECQTTNSKQKPTIQEKESLCYVGCQRRKSTECVNTSDLDKVKKYPELDGLLTNISVDSKLLPVQLPVGTPCNKNTGYCDVFRRCRGADPDTPLVKLKECLASGECSAYVVSILKVYWWAVLLCSIPCVILFYLFVKCCAVHTKSSNPIMEERHPHRSVRQSVSSVYDTVSHPRRSFRNSVRSVRASLSRMNSWPLSSDLDLKKIEEELEVLNKDPRTSVDDVFL